MSASMDNKTDRAAETRVVELAADTRQNVEALGAPTERPTRVRYTVLAFACALAMLTYLDRVCFSTAQGDLVKDLNLSSVADLKWAFTAFGIAYALFEVPSGWFGDRYGPRGTLIRIVMWWSLFTALTGFSGLKILGLTLGMEFLVFVRFCFGVGEAGAFPNITRSLHNWFPVQERGFAQGMVFMASRIFGGLTPLIWTVLVVGIEYHGTDGVRDWSLPPMFHWREAFFLFGFLGILWCVLFAISFRDRPEQKSSVNAAELQLIRQNGSDAEEIHSAVPWMKLFSSVNLWALCLMYACQAYGWYFNITYLPSYLENQHAVEAKSFEGAIYKGCPLLFGAIACVTGGWLTDAFIRRTGDRRWGRRVWGIIGHSVCVIAFISCAQATSPFSIVALLSLASFSTDITLAPAWATCQDIGKRYAAIVAGCMNMIGNLGGALSAWAVGAILQWSMAQRASELGVAFEQLSAEERSLAMAHGYQLNFLIFAAIYVVAVMCWFRIDATEPVAPDPETFKVDAA